MSVYGFEQRRCWRRQRQSPLRQVQAAIASATSPAPSQTASPPFDVSEPGPPARAATSVAIGARRISGSVDESRRDLTLESGVEEFWLNESLKILKSKGQAPGRDGITYRDLGKIETCELIRGIRQDVLHRCYLPSEPLDVRIPKGHRRYRELSLRNVRDRILARAVFELISPIIDARLLPSCFGFRPGKGIYHLLAQVCRTVELTGQSVMLEADVANAFPSLPIDGIMHAYRQHIHDEGLLWLIETITRGHLGAAQPRGIAQGCPLSPLSFNDFMLHLYDLPLYAAGRHESPLRQFRYADNLVYVCPSVSDGTQRLAEARCLLSPAGLELKPKHTLIDLRRQGARIDILGFQLRLVNNRLQMGVGKKAYAGLRESLAAACLSPAPPDTARMAVEGWLGAIGPAVESVCENEVISQVQRLAAGYGYRAVGSIADLRDRLQGAHQRWVALREQVLRG